MDRRAPNLRPLPVESRVAELRRRGLGLRSIENALVRIATPEEIRCAWRNLAAAYHPHRDVTP